MTSKHPRTSVTDSVRDADLRGNPGIGQSKGMEGTDPALIETDNTVEGDVENETETDGSIDPNHRGRTNR